ncbi:hypothetical protein [Longimicrobium sp.]|uniref:hypothetical protein n=1 Tax=Longimicrobium sp. TaxID=2029185 RepID=UPI002B9FCFF0|nr:hypothetical protein [Longimicrobium sp.]HSU17456.1 hypothetical protein [Longimicrobium sp.]
MLTVLALALPARASAQSACPPDNSEARDVAGMFLVDPAFQEERQTSGTTLVDPSHLRVLNDAQDAAVCSRLWSGITVAEYRSAPWLPVFYTADGFYFIAVVKGPIEQTRLRVENGAIKGEMYLVPFSVLDQAFTVRLDTAL